MKDNPERGWIKYERLENEFLNATLYVPLVDAHKQVWSEFFGDLLNKIGNSIDSFLHMMIDDYDFDTEYQHVSTLRKSKRKRDITYFRDFFEPIFQLSDSKVDVSYGLTEYGIIYPFKKFGNDSVPDWWNSYNHVKHQWFDCIQEATLQHTIEALAGLFMLNVLYKKSRKYLLRENVIFCGYDEKDFGKYRFEDILTTSDVGIPKDWSNFDFTAETPLFTHVFRIDQNKQYR